MAIPGRESSRVEAVLPVNIPIEVRLVMEGAARVANGQDGAEVKFQLHFLDEVIPGRSMRVILLDGVIVLAWRIVALDLHRNRKGARRGKGFELLWIRRVRKDVADR